MALLPFPPLRTVRESFPSYGSSMGAGLPKFLAFFPVERNGKLLAVLELASFSAFDGAAQALVDSLLPVLAMSLEILERNQKFQEHLEQLQGTNS